jgi:radical SAM superfamily enzyme YgiQ (UPF0313 family)
MQSFNRKMHILLVNPKTPTSYWGLQESTRFVGARAAHIPLSLITLAALLPREWHMKLVDMNMERLRDKDIARADAVLVTGMIIQRKSMEDVLRRCAELGAPTVVGGPFVSSSPDAKELTHATALVIGEAEDADVIGRLIEDLGAGTLAGRYVAAGRPDLSESPTPRYDLLRRKAYCVMSVQVSRGCPHGCEFCNVRILFGRRPRYKSPEQVTAELQAIWDTGDRGNVFFVDDNFIGNPRKAADILRAVDEWQKEYDLPFQFFTETDIKLAERDDLIDLMNKAGFFAVFIGFESPSEEALKASAKRQNVGVDAVEAARHLRSKGLQVYGGFIVGFDTDGPDCGRLIQEMVESSSIDFAMPGMLVAIPGTPLEQRLRAEGRLIENASEGDQFDLTNVLPKGMSRLELLRIYRELIERLYRPKHYFERAYAALAEWKLGAVRRAAKREYLAVVRSVLRQGVFSTYSLHYWKFLLRTLLRNPRKASRAFAMAICGHHFFVYTRKVVLPRLRKAEQMLLEQEAASQPAS